MRRVDDDRPGYAEEPGWNGDVWLDYSYDGRACELEFFAYPANLRGVPCSRELAERLLFGGHEVERDSIDFTHQPLKEDLPVCDIRVTTGVREGVHAITLHLRDGEAAYSTDVVGDGTEAIVYSYDGQALRIELSQAAETPVLTVGMPCESEVNATLRSMGLRVVDDDASDPSRPWLERITRRNLKCGPTIGADIEYSRGRSSTSVPVAEGHGLLYLSADGCPTRLELHRLEDGVRLVDVPARERVLAILRHQGFRVLD